MWRNMWPIQETGYRLAVNTLSIPSMLRKLTAKYIDDEGLH